MELVKNNDWQGLQFLMNAEVVRKGFPKHLVFTPDEKDMLHLLAGNYMAATAAFIPDEYRYIEDGKRKYRYKAWPRDHITIELDNILFQHSAETRNKINMDGSLSNTQKEFVLLKLRYYETLAAPQKKELLKLLDSELGNARKTLSTKSYPELVLFKKYSRHLKLGAFFGLGISGNTFTKGFGQVFHPAIGIKGHFELYHNCVSWYFGYNFSRFKNRADTAFRQFSWPNQTKNTMAEFNAGLGLLVYKSDYTRLTLNAGGGYWRIRPLNKENSIALRNISIKRFPFLSLGGSLDFANLKYRMTNKQPKNPVGLRLFYQHNFLRLDKNYPEFKTNLHSFGLMFGLSV